MPRGFLPRGLSNTCPQFRSCCGQSLRTGRCRTTLNDFHRSGRLQFFGEHAALADAHTFARWLAPLRQCQWVVYAKRPFAGPAAVLAYLSRYTHRVAISNGRLLAIDEHAVTFRWKDYRAKGRTRHKIMTLPPKSSCAASCCTYYPLASIASATMACWPTAHAPPISRSHARCSTMPRPKARTPTPPPHHRVSCVVAVVHRWSSSKPSCPHT